MAIYSCKELSPCYRPNTCKMTHQPLKWRKSETGKILKQILNNIQNVSSWSWKRLKFRLLDVWFEILCNSPTVLVFIKYFNVKKPIWIAFCFNFARLGIFPFWGLVHHFTCVKMMSVIFRKNEFPFSHSFFAHYFSNRLHFGSNFDVLKTTLQSRAIWSDIAFKFPKFIFFSLLSVHSSKSLFILW